MNKYERLKHFFKFTDRFLVAFLLFVLASGISLVYTVWCVEIATWLLLFFMLPFISVVGVTLNVLYTYRHRNKLVNTLQYTNFCFIILVMAYYWLEYNTCNIFGNSISLSFV